MSNEEPPVATRDTASSTVAASSRALRLFSRNVVPRIRGHSEEVRPTQWDTNAEFSLGSRPSEFISQSEVGSGVIDALQRDLEGPSVYPMTDDAEVEETPFPRRRQSRRLVLIPPICTQSSVRRQHSPRRIRHERQSGGLTTVRQ